MKSSHTSKKTQTKGELERLSLQLATTQKEITSEAMNLILAAWRAQFDRLQQSGNVRDQSLAYAIRCKD